MRTVTALVAFCYLMFLMQAVAQTTSLEGLVDPLDPASTLDLADAPLGITVLQLGALKFRDQVVQSTFSKQLAAMTLKIENAITGKNKLGYLLKVEIYSDEFGTPVIPQGQLIFPIGVGTEPVDALAEFIRGPLVLHAPPAGLSNCSYYLWITKLGDKYSASAIRPEFRGVLEKRSAKEAERRNLLAAYTKALPADGFQSVQRAAYWQEVLRTYADQLSSEAHRQQVQALTQQFEDAQERFNTAYKAFQETEAELANQRRFSQTLLIASTVSQIVENACRIKSLVSLSGASVSARGAPRMSLKETSEQLRIQIGETTVEYKRQLRIIELQERYLAERNGQLKQLFQQDGIPIPKAEEPMLREP